MFNSAYLSLTFQLSHIRMRYFLSIVLICLIACQSEEQATILPIPEAIQAYPECAIFSFVDTEPASWEEWTVEPTGLNLIPEGDGSYLIKGFLISSDGRGEACYLNVVTPERIADFVIMDSEEWEKKLLYELTEQEVIPAVAAECPGMYDLYFSSHRPKAGIDVLRAGLDLIPNHPTITQDLAYVLRDAEQYEAALGVFEQLVAIGDSSSFVLEEIEGLKLVRKEKIE